MAWDRRRDVGRCGVALALLACALPARAGRMEAVLGVSAHVEARCVVRAGLAGRVVRAAADCPAATAQRRVGEVTRVDFVF